MARLLSSAPVSIAIYLCAVAFVVLSAYNGSQAMGYNWQWYRIPDYLYRFTDDGFQWGEIIIGLFKTLQLSFLSFSLALIIGTAMALLRLSGLLVGSAFAVVLLELVRNMPLLVLLYLFYYVLGPIFGLDRFTAAMLCLAVYHGALISEIVRAGISAVPQGQWEGAYAMGLTKPQTYQLVVLPQSIPLMLPPLTGEMINLLKSSAIVSVIAVAELTTIGRNIISDTYMSFEIWFTIAAVYLLVTLLMSFGVTLLERRYALRAQ